MKSIFASDRFNPTEFNLRAGAICASSQIRRRGTIWLITFLIFGAGLLFQPLRTPQVSAATATCSQAYLNSLPVPKPLGDAVRVVQLINCSSQTLLGATNAAAAGGDTPVPTFPRENTWVMQPFGSPNGANVLTIDIPKEWVNTGPNKSIGPNIWARTGCRYDPVTNRAQCETGGCGGQYDCSSAALGVPGFTTFTEWNFYQPPPNPNATYHLENFDISVVNGASLTVDIQQVGGDARDPGDTNNQFWLALNVPPNAVNYPMTVHGQDLRSPANCSTAFQLLRSQIDKSRDINGNALYGYVQLGPNGLPVGGDNVVACFNNCGYYKYPFEPSVPGCTDPTDPACYCDDTKNTPASIRCYNWKTFCAGDPLEYGTKFDPTAPPGKNNCITNGRYNDSVCPVNAQCWRNPGSTLDGTCQLSAFYNAATCPNNVCTFQNPYNNPLTKQTDLSTQPPNGLCKDVIDANNQQAPCIGDDTVHTVFNRGYTWPNDPQVYSADAPLYRVIYAPGGTVVPITPAQQGIPLCSSLASIYNYNQNKTSCSIPVQDEGAVFAVANANGTPWSCSLDQRGSGNEGVICRWNPPPTTPTGCTPPATDANVTRSACGTIPSGTSLVSSSLKPAVGDPLFAEVTIPAVLNPVNLPASISGCVTAWKVVTQQFIETDRGLAIWYQGVANTSSSCKVTVALDASDPAALKVYDIPKFNGVIDASSGATGADTAGPNVGTGSLKTNHAPDLLLGNLLLTNAQLTPQSYWEAWLTNDTLDCTATSIHCPTDDGTDYLPGYGRFSSNSDSGHQLLPKAGTYTMTRQSNPVSKSDFGGAAIAIEVNP